MKGLRSLVWITVCSCLVISWLPYFDILNEPIMIGFLPQPLAVTLICNIILTLCVMALYPLYFKPFIRTLKDRPVEGERHE